MVVLKLIIFQATFKNIIFSDLIFFGTVPLCNVTVLGRKEGYMVKYMPSPEGVPRAKPEGTLEGKGYI